MQVDTEPTAATSYARTLVERGCSPSLAFAAGQILAYADGIKLTPEEQALIARAYAQLTQ